MSDALDQLLSRLQNVQRRGDGASARCPAHDDRNASLSVSTAANGNVLVKCHAGCTAEAVVAAAGLTLRDLFAGDASPTAAKPRRARSTPAAARRIVATYDYRDAENALLFQAVRYEPKDFRQRRPDGCGGWIGNLQGVNRVLYRLPELLNAAEDRPDDWRFVVEGEKDADALHALGLIATCNPMGAGKWQSEYSETLRGGRVCVIADKDAPGRSHAAAVAAGCRGIAACVRVTEVPAGKDASDYIASGATAADVIALADAAAEWTPDPDDVPEVPPPPTTYQPFPIDLLPPAAAAIVRAGAASIGCDPAYLALPALAAMAGAIGNIRHAVVKTGWTEPAIVWAMLIGQSGTAKTPAAKIVLGPLHERHGKLIAANEEAMKLYRDDCKHYEADLAIWKRKAEGDPPEEPDAPALERAVIEDTTIEALAPILRANPRGVLLHRDELAGWIGSFDRYAQNGGGDVARWLSIFNAEPITVDRKSSGTTYVPLPAVSVIGGIQPDRLPVVLTRTLRDTGLLARILIAHPPATPKRFNPENLDAVALDDWQKLQTYLSTLDMAADAEGKPKPIYIGMSGDAKRAFGDWADAHNAATIDRPGEVAAARSKLEAYAVRFALIFAVCEPAGKIERDHVDRGCTLADWFAAEAERIYDRVGESDDDRDRRELRALIEARGGRITPRDLQRARPKRFRSADTAEAALLRLVECGDGTWQPAPATGRPGRPPPRVFALTHRQIDTIGENAAKMAIVSNRQSVDAPHATKEGAADAA